MAATEDKMNEAENPEDQDAKAARDAAEAMAKAAEPIDLAAAEAEAEAEEEAEESAEEIRVGFCVDRANATLKRLKEVGVADFMQARRGARGGKHFLGIEGDDLARVIRCGPELVQAPQPIGALYGADQAAQEVT
mgnify:CR=1 FL=1